MCFYILTIIEVSTAHSIYTLFDKLILHAPYPTNTHEIKMLTTLKFIKSL